jgi:anti-sigma-K factor RskA
MQHPSRELIDRLAAEYVLGTLRGPARQRFARWIESDAGAAAATRSWEDRLAHLADDVRSVTPSPLVWREIERRIGAPTASQARHWYANWRPLALAASVVLAVALFWVLDTRDDSANWQLAAQLRDDKLQQSLWKVEYDATDRSLQVSAEVPYALPSGTVHELWALPANGAAPVSLGLLPQTGSRKVALDPAQAAALLAAGQLAVSREPAGGSPTGAPTGPVLIVSKRLPLA